MWSIFVLSFLISTVCGATIGENNGSELLGDYKLLFVWPKTSQYIPNCTPTSYKKLSLNGAHFSCECGRTNFNLALIKQDTKYVGKTILFDVVKTADEASAALSDKCHCEPLNLARYVARKLNDNLMLQYEQEDILRHYIFGKEVLSESQLRDVISTLTELKYEDGQISVLTLMEDWSGTNYTKLDSTGITPVSESFSRGRDSPIIQHINGY